MLVSESSKASLRTHTSSREEIQKPEVPCVTPRIDGRHWGPGSYQGPSPAQSPSPFSQRNWSTPFFSGFCACALGLQGWASGSEPLCVHTFLLLALSWGNEKLLMSHRSPSSSRLPWLTQLLPQSQDHSFAHPTVGGRGQCCWERGPHELTYLPHSLLKPSFLCLQEGSL